MLAILALTVATPSTATATTTSDLERALLVKINDARADHGLRPLRVGHRIWSIAGTRAARMASTNVLSHTVGGNLASQLHAKSVPWYGYGEDIGYTRTKRGTAAMSELFRLWKASPAHWKLMMSSSYNYIGIGLAYRSSNGKTFGSLVFTESPDLTDAIAKVDDVWTSGNSATWSWHGWDPLLQTHTAGMRSYDVQVRVDSGSWKNAATKVTATQKVWNGLSSGHLYSLRVRARDRVGNLGGWSEVRIRMP